MAKTLIERLGVAKVVPVIRHNDPEVASQACHILAEEGLHAVEITMTVPKAADLIADLRASMPDVLIGAGTVLSRKEAEAVLAAGAEFVVSPCWCDDVAEAVLAAKTPYLPGAMTPGEVLRHASSGAMVVKVFPADMAGGPGFIKSVKAVFPDIELMPTGGVAPKDVEEYLTAGALCTGIGSHLLPALALEEGDAEAARTQIRTALETTQFEPLRREA
jgi:2-dehydro-3-deoxyphosphogluconate aldolase/(4S)-4-hydroxy-2-oxoglutarate aldolase